MSRRECQTCQAFKKGTEIRCKRRTCTTADLCWQHAMSAKGLRVKASTITGAGLGLFVSKDTPRLHTLDEYTGDRVNQIRPGVFDKNVGEEYLLERTKTIWIDASSTQSCLARYANACDYVRTGTPVRCNAKFVTRGTRIFLVTTAPIEKGGEIFVPYGSKFWSRDQQEDPAYHIEEQDEIIDDDDVAPLPPMFLQTPVLRPPPLTTEQKLSLIDLKEQVSNMRRIVILTGAGISTSSGIPDYHDGSRIMSMDSRRVLRFSSLANLEQRAILLNFMNTMERINMSAVPSPTHRVIAALAAKKKLLRCYTQNIDTLQDELLQEDRLVHLHGQLKTTRCTVCETVEPLSSMMLADYRRNVLHKCDVCRRRAVESRRPRARRIGELRPNIVLYDEANPNAELVGEQIAADLMQEPDMFLVLGTRLGVNGARHMVRDIARQTTGPVVYIGNTAAPNELRRFFTHEFKADLDTAMMFLFALTM